MRVNAYVAPILETYVYIYMQVKFFSWNESGGIVVSRLAGRPMCHLFNSQR